MFLFWILGIVGVIVYVIGVICVSSTETIENAEFHASDSFFGGYTTHDNREMTAQDVRKGLIWPILLLILFFYSCLYLLNELLKGFFLIFNYKYNNTKMYKTINKKINFFS